MIRAFDHHDFDAAELAANKRGVRVSVCLPARNEEATVGAIVAAIREQLVERVPLVDEILVVDDHSDDGTAGRAAAAGARVVATAGSLADELELPPGPGKGRALWLSVHESTGDLVVWCDADVTNFGPQFVVGLLGPLLAVPSIGFVKGFYQRPLGAGGEGGGRVTELVARPLLSLLFPELAGFVQPLAGEYAGRRELLEQVPFMAGYGVEIGLLIDLARSFGTAALGQVDLGTRRHRNRPLSELGPQAMTIMQVALRRSAPDLVAPMARLERPDEPSVLVTATELPPLDRLPAYRARHPGPRHPGAAAP